MKWIAAAGILLTGFITLSYIAFPALTDLDYIAVGMGKSAPASKETILEEAVTDEREVVTHVPLPLPTKAIYMTSCVAGTPRLREGLVSLIDETEINAVVIDIKDYSGTISFPPKDDAWKPAWQDARCGTADMEDFIAELHKKKIFVVGRITVFQDPYYTKIRPDLAVAKRSDGTMWHDRKGLSFVDVGARDYWDHIINLSVDSYNIGFDELNFDYVRYPSDGNMEDIAFPKSWESEYGKDKQANLEAFFKYLNEKLDDEALYADVRHTNAGREKTTPWTSVDLFGMTTSNFDDLSIGQIQERAAPYFDFVAPMVYPSHYPKTFIGLGDPNDHPYEIVHYAMSAGVKRMTATTTKVAGFTHERIGTSTPVLYKKNPYSPDKFRTWIQDFDYGGDYDAQDVRAQIKASEDAGVKSYMVWAPSNVYTRDAFAGE